MTSPDLLKPDSVATFVIARCGFFEPGVVTSAHFEAAPPGPSSTQAWLKNEPASTSAWVIVWLAVQLIVAPGASEEPLAGVQDRPEAFGSVTVTAARVVLPVFVATIV